MWKNYLNNPCGRNVGDCSVRAISKVLDMDWETAYIKLVVNGFSMCDMPSSNSVIASVLRENGFKKAVISDECPECYTVADFCEDNKVGSFVLGTGNHVVATQDGDYFDSWDSGKEIPIYVWYKDIKPKSKFNKGDEM